MTTQNANIEINAIGYGEYSVIGPEVLCRELAAQFTGATLTYSNNRIRFSVGSGRRELDAIQSAANRINVRNTAPVDNTPHTNNARAERIVVQARTTRVGDIIHGNRVVGLGKTWLFSDDDHERLGCRWPHHVGECVQYAYF